jgi:hypothetical protein
LSLKSDLNGQTGEAIAFSILMQTNGLRVLKRSIDTDGADIYVTLPNRKLQTLGKIQVKYSQDENTSHYIPAKYISEVFFVMVVVCRKFFEHDCYLFKKSDLLSLESKNNLKKEYLINKESLSGVIKIRSKDDLLPIIKALESHTDSELVVQLLKEFPIGLSYDSRLDKIKSPPIDLENELREIKSCMRDAAEKAYDFFCFAIECAISEDPRHVYEAALMYRNNYYVYNFDTWIGSDPPYAFKLPFINHISDDLPATDEN